MATVLLRTDDKRNGLVFLCDPKTGEALTRLSNPAIYTFWSYVSSEYEHPEGLLFPDEATARRELAGKHRIVTD